jgi:hypothetical protein
MKPQNAFPAVQKERYDIPLPIVGRFHKGSMVLKRGMVVAGMSLAVF